MKQFASTPTATEGVRSGGFFNFLLVLGGISCLVAGRWHLPRYQEYSRLEVERTRLEVLIREAHEHRADYERLQEAMVHQPHFRDIVLRRVTGQHPYPVLTIPEWIAEKDARRAAGVGGRGQGTP